MRTRGKILLAFLTAALILGAAAGAATARRIEISERDFLIRWDGVAPRTLLSFSGVGIEVACRVTLKGSFHSRTIAKVNGALVGYMEEAIVEHPCPNEDITGEYFFLNGTETLHGVVVPQTLPWHIKYDSFRGTLPAITGIRIDIIGLAILFWSVGIRCLYASTEVNPLTGTIQVNALHQLTNFVLEEGTIVTLVRTIEGFCPRSLTARGTAFWGDGPKSGTPVTVRLVQ